MQSIGGPSGQCVAVLDSEQLSQHRHRVDRDDVDVESILAVPAIHVVVEHFGNVPGPLREAVGARVHINCGIRDDGLDGIETGPQQERPG